MGRIGATNNTMDAAGESTGLIGRVFLEAGSGSKTISSSGGQIYLRFGTVTFANAGTNLRIGIQDVATTGLEDGTFDVYADLVGGTDTITGSAVRKTAMETGSKTINHGDIVAVVVEMTARGGTDSVQLTRASGNTPVGSGFPYTTADTGTLAKQSNPMPLTTIEFDDGTMGWFAPYYLAGNVYSSANTIDFSQSDTPDEHAAVFKVPFKCQVNAVAINIGSPSSGRTFEIVFYSDAEGTPTVIETFTPDEDLFSTNSGLLWCYLTTPQTLTIGTWYAISLRPTTVNTNRILYYDLGSGFEKLKRPSDFGSNMKLSKRTNQTGAFVETQTYHLPLFAIQVSKLDDGVQVGGLKTHPGMAGGMRG